MTPARVVELALLAYPREVRDVRGSEMAGTVLDVSSSSWSRLWGESFALVRSGFRARARLTAESGGRRLAATVCAQGVTVWGLVLLMPMLQVDRLRIEYGGAFSHEAAIFSVEVLLMLATATALAGYDRIAALFGLAWIGVLLQAALTSPSWGVPVVHSVALTLVPLTCYSTMLLVPRTRRRDARRLLWLAAAVLAGLAWSFGPTSLGVGLGLSGLVLLTLLVAGLFLLSAAPSLSLAFAVALIGYGLSWWTRARGVGFVEGDDVRSAMTTAGPLLLAGGAALRLVSARRSVPG